MAREKIREEEDEELKEFKLLHPDFKYPYSDPRIKWKNIPPKVCPACGAEEDHWHLEDK